jgi:hypothetical protein
VPEESVPELLLLLFQIVPFIFSILLRISSPQFDSTWGNKLAEYENALDLDLDRDAHEWKYKHLTTYLYDQTSFSRSHRVRVSVCLGAV